MHLRRLVLVAILICLVVLSSACGRSTSTGQAEGRSGGDAGHAGHVHGGAIRSLPGRDIVALAGGEGGGLAKIADLNGYPGPRHVLDMDAHLNLTTRQREQLRQVMSTMEADAKEVATRYLSALAQLEEDTRQGSLSGDQFLKRYRAVEALRTELGAVHLITHFKTKDLLTPAQVATYYKPQGQTH